VPPAPIQKEKAKGIEVTLGSTKKEIQTGQPVDLIVTITNHTKEEFSYLQYKLQDLHDFTMTGPDGKEVERKPNPVEISFAGTPVKVLADEKVTVKEGLQGINLPKAGTNRYLRHGYYPMDVPGTYRLRIRVGDVTSNELQVKVVGKEGAAEGATEKDGVRFEILLPDRVWAIPENKAGRRISIKLGLRITNQTDRPQRFTRFDTLFPDMLGPDGKALSRRNARRETLPIREADCPLVKPADSATFDIDADLFWQDGKLCFGGSDG